MTTQTEFLALNNEKFPTFIVRAFLLFKDFLHSVCVCLCMHMKEKDGGEGLREEENSRVESTKIHIDEAKRTGPQQDGAHRRTQGRTKLLPAPILYSH